MRRWGGCSSIPPGFMPTAGLHKNQSRRLALFMQTFWGHKMKRKPHPRTPNQAFTPQWTRWHLQPTWAPDVRAEFLLQSVFPVFMAVTLGHAVEKSRCISSPAQGCDSFCLPLWGRRSGKCSPMTTVVAWGSKMSLRYLNPWRSQAQRLTWCLVLLCLQLALSLPIFSAAEGGGTALPWGRGIAGGRWVVFSSWPWEMRLLTSLGFQIMQAKVTLVHIQMLSNRKLCIGKKNSIESRS